LLGQAFVSVHRDCCETAGQNLGAKEGVFGEAREIREKDQRQDLEARLALSDPQERNLGEADIGQYAQLRVTEGGGE